MLKHCLAILLAALLATPLTASETQIFIQDVTVIPMTVDGKILPHSDVLIRHGRIVAVGKVKAPRKALRIDGRGKFLMPGLTDAHAHMLNKTLLRVQFGHDDPGFETMNVQDQLIPLIANGVTQIFDLASTPETLAMKARIERGAILGPHIATAFLVDGGDAVRPGTETASTPEQGRRLVRALKRQGYDALKTYSRLDRATFLAMVDEARRLGMRVVGHIPNAFRGDTGAALVPGFGLVAHAEEYAKQSKELSEADADKYVAAAKRNGTWLIATADTSRWIARQTRDPQSVRKSPVARYLDPITANIWFDNNPYTRRASAERADRFDRIVAFDTMLIRKFAAAGIPVLVGTDAPIPGVGLGFSVHDEMARLVSDGLTNLQALSGATRLPALWLGLANDRGTVERGKRADLLLLDANPLTDIANTKRMAGVILGGRWLPRAELDAMMEGLARRNAALPPFRPVSSPKTGQ